MKVRKDDVWVVTYPKCGTTWTQEILWNIVNGVQVERIKEPLFDRSPFIDIPRIDGEKDAAEFFAQIDEMPSPRVIKVIINPLFEGKSRNLFKINFLESLSLRAPTTRPAEDLQGHFCLQERQGLSRRTNIL